MSVFQTTFSVSLQTSGRSGSSGDDPRRRSPKLQPLVLSGGCRPGAGSHGEADGQDRDPRMARPPTARSGPPSSVDACVFPHQPRHQPRPINHGRSGSASTALGFAIRTGPSRTHCTVRESPVKAAQLAHNGGRAGSQPPPRDGDSAPEPTRFTTAGRGRQETEHASKQRNRGPGARRAAGAPRPGRCAGRRRPLDRHLEHGPAGARPPASPEAGEAAAGLPFGAPVRLADQTVRQVVRTSIGGSEVRVTISNVFGSERWPSAPRTSRRARWDRGSATGPRSLSAARPR